MASPLFSNIILLVEDNPTDEELTLRAFQKNKITNQVVVARDGEEALEYLFATGRYAGRDILDLPQLILLDLKLPKVDGLEILQRIRTDERIKRTPVVVLTSSKEEEDLMGAYDRGANAYVRKPVDFMEFNSAIQYLGMFWLLLNQNCTCQSPAAAR